MTLGELWPQPGVVALYHLAASSGTDSSGNGYTLTQGLANIILGKFGAAHGETTFTAAEDSTANNLVTPASDNFSVSAWIKCNELPYATHSTHGLFQLAHDATSLGGCDLFYAYYSAGPKYQLQWAWANENSNMAGSSEDAIPQFPLGVWVRLVVTCSSAGTMNIYLNGNLYSTGSRVAAGTSGRIFAIGRGWYGSDQNGAETFDEVCVWNKVLDAQYIRRLYALGKGLLD